MAEITTPRTEADAFAERLPQPQRFIITEELSALLLPYGWRAEDRKIHLPDVKPRPDRKRGTITLNDAESFIAHVLMQGDPPEAPPASRSIIYVEADYTKVGNVRFTAVLNDHDELPQWRDYRAVYSPTPSVEWKLWTTANLNPMSQGEFAEFIENNAKDIAGVEGMPTSAQMLQMALTFESTAEARIKSSIRLQSGATAFAYTDAEDDATLKRMEAFSRFSLGIPPFFNGAAYRLDARLKYRLQSSKLNFWFELIRPDLVVQDATREVIGRIRTEIPHVPVLMGVP